MITRLLDKGYRVDPLKNTGNITEMIFNPNFDEVFLEDNKIVDRVQKNSFPTDEKQEGGYRVDITTVDYIGSLNYSTGILTLVPNPWKGAVYKDVVIMEYPK